MEMIFNDNASNITMLTEEENDQKFFEEAIEMLEENKDSDDEDFELLEFLKQIKLKKKINLQLIEMNKRKWREKIEKIKEKRRLKQKEGEIKFKSEKFSRNIPNALLESNDDIVKEFMNSKSLNEMMNVLEIKLYKKYGSYNSEEKTALMSTENFILLGRSGTGKTFIALNKIFLLEMVFSLKSVKAFLKDKNFHLRLIFCTPSSILVKESQKYYTIMGKKFKEEVNNISQIQQKVFTPEENDILFDVNKEFERFQLFDTITEKDYPLFIPTMTLLKLIDSTLNNPFFSRDKEGKIKTDADENNLYTEYNRIFQIEESILKRVYKTNYDNLPHHTDPFLFIKLINFKYFEKKFWIKEKTRHKETDGKLNVLVIWTEIMSHIKGAAMSYSYESWHLPKDYYRDYVGLNKTFVTKEMKEKIWDIAQNYEKWKSSEQIFDLMDLVSYLLNEIIQKNFIFPNRPHAIFIDEVQDLQPSILFLISLISKEEIVFCGDTAQTISKGMDFRFSDLKKLFFHYNEIYEFNSEKNQNQDKEKEKEHRKNTELNEKNQSKNKNKIKEKNVDNTKDNLKRDENKNKFKKSNEVQMKNKHPYDFAEIKEEESKHLAPKLAEIQQNKKTFFPFFKNEILLKDLEFNVLKINYRSQAKIIEFGNLVITILEILYPTSLDIIAKEKPVKEGIKPIIISDKNLLQEVLKESNNQFNILMSPTVGMSQIILVRNYESKKQFSETFPDSKYLIFTIYESKGLEFDDVILYDFFSNSEVSEENWEVLDLVDVKNLNLFEKASEFDVKKEIKNLNMSKYEDLKDELKNLYTAITRTRLKLIIYDENPIKRKQIEKFLEFFNIADIESDSEKLRIKMKDNNAKITNSGLISYTFKDVPTSKQKEYEIALKYFNFNFYEQAEILFEKLGLKKQANLSKAFFLIEKAKECEETESLKYFQQAAILFEIEGYIKEAAKCYYSCQFYEASQKLFEQIDCWNEAGESILKQIEQKPQYSSLLMPKAISQFEKAKNNKRLIYCYEVLKDYQKIIEVLILIKNKICDFNETLVKYLYLFLKDIDSKLDRGGIKQSLEIAGSISLFKSNKPFLDFFRFFQFSQDFIKFIPLPVTFSKEILLKIGENAKMSENFLKYLLKNKLFEMGTYFSYEFDLKECFRLFVISIFMENNIDFKGKNNFIINNGEKYEINLCVQSMFEKQILDHTKLINSIFLLNPYLYLRLTSQQHPENYDKNYLEEIDFDNYQFDYYNESEENILNLLKIFIFEKDLLSILLKKFQFGSFEDFITKYFDPFFQLSEMFVIHNRDWLKSIILIIECFYPGYFNWIKSESSHIKIIGEWLIPIREELNMTKSIKKFFRKINKKDELLVLNFEKTELILIPFDYLIIFFCSKLVNSCFRLLKNLEKKVKIFESNSDLFNIYHCLYGFAKRLKYLGTNLNENLNKLQTLYGKNDFLNEYLSNEEIIKQKREISNLIRKENDKYNEKQILKELKRLRLSQYKISKNNKYKNNQIISFNKLLSIMHYKFFLREKVIFFFLQTEINYGYEFESNILSAIYRNKFKGKHFFKHHFFLKNNEQEIRIFLNEFSESIFNNFNKKFTDLWSSLFFLNGKNINEMKEKQIIFKFLRFFQINELYDEAYSFPLTKRNFDFIHLNVIFKKFAPYFSLKNWGFKSNNRYEHKNKAKIIEFYSEVIQKFCDFDLHEFSEPNFMINNFFLDYEVKHFIIIPFKIFYKLKEEIKKFLAEAFILIITYLNCSIQNYSKQNILCSSLIGDYIKNLFFIQSKIIITFWIKEDAEYKLEQDISYNYLLKNVLNLLILIFKFSHFMLKSFQKKRYCHLSKFFFDLVSNIKIAFNTIFTYKKELDCDRLNILKNVKILKKIYNLLNIQLFLWKKDSSMTNKAIINEYKQISNPFSYCLDYFDKLFIPSSQFKQQNQFNPLFPYLLFCYSAETSEPFTSDLRDDYKTINEMIKNEKYISELMKIKKNAVKNKLESMSVFHLNKKNMGVLERIKSFFDLEDNLEKINKVEISELKKQIDKFIKDNKFNDHQMKI